jgi:protein translocase SecG subunit
MSYLAGVLTFALIANCAVLIFLVLIQLPKKDAGAGLAFGSGAADALFGAGSGNALTKITKWATVLFLLICLMLGVIQDSVNSKGDASVWTKKVDERSMSAPAPATVPTGDADRTGGSPSGAGYDTAVRHFRGGGFDQRDKIKNDFHRTRPTEFPTGAFSLFVAAGHVSFRLRPS